MNNQLTTQIAEIIKKDKLEAISKVLQKDTIDLDQYSEVAIFTSVAPTDLQERCRYLLMGLMGECGEIAEAYKRYLRDDKFHLNFRSHTEKIAGEIGDLLWYFNGFYQTIKKDLQHDLKPFRSLIALPNPQLDTITTIVLIAKLHNTVTWFTDMMFEEMKNADTLKFKGYMFDLEFRDYYDEYIYSDALLSLGRNIARLCENLEIPIERVARMNLEKISRRLQNDTIKGKGSDR